MFFAATKGRHETDVSARHSLFHRIARPYGIALAAWSLLGALHSAFGAEASKAPNIVLIMADDLGYAELGCYGQIKIKTPHVDALAAEGMRFTQFYCGAPVCAPARCGPFAILRAASGGGTMVRDGLPHRVDHGFKNVF